jgi:predicted DNA-binding transcriptional regulator YafY
MARHRQFVRLWTLFRRLEGAPHGLTVAELTEGGDAARRSFYRDIDALAEAGVPVYAEDYRGTRRWFVNESLRRNRLVPLPGLGDFGAALGASRARGAGLAAARRDRWFDRKAR